MKYPYYLICAWNVFLEDYSESDDVMEELLDDVKEAGFNTIGIRWTNNTAAMLGILKKLESRDLRLIIKKVPDIEETEGPGFDHFFDSLEKSKVFTGFMLRDEPSAMEFAELAELKLRYNEKIEDNRNAFTICNLYPNYASNEQLGVISQDPRNSDTDTLQQIASIDIKSYNRYLDEYISVFKPEILCYDHYPITYHVRNDIPESEAFIYRYFSNLCETYIKSSSAGIPLFSFIQAWTFTDLFVCPNYNEYIWMMNTCYALGVEGILCFTYRNFYPEKGGPEAWKDCPITLDRTRTPTYETVSQCNRDFMNTISKYIDYEYEGVYAYNCPAHINKALRNTIDIGEIDFVSGLRGSGEALISLFSKDNDKGLFIVNTRIHESSCIEITFDHKTDYTVQYKDDSVTHKSSDGLSLKLDGGEAVFVCIK
ncbi:hypothetical protein EOM86_05605 [Candidatus Nomurabacteria bacterium]|nr:hypothetical protein [Candidatus Nomurabacteria bacterium]